MVLPKATGLHHPLKLTQHCGGGDRKCVRAIGWGEGLQNGIFYVQLVYGTHKLTGLGILGLSPQKSGPPNSQQWREKGLTGPTTYC